MDEVLHEAKAAAADENGVMLIDHGEAIQTAHQERRTRETFDLFTNRGAWLHDARGIVRMNSERSLIGLGDRGSMYLSVLG